MPPPRAASTPTPTPTPTSSPGSSSIAFVTCAADLEKHRRLRESLGALFPGPFAVEIDLIDNTARRYTAPQALNIGWERARSDLLVFCHDDVVFPPDWLGRLRSEIDAVEHAHGDAPWAVLGPMGRAGKLFFGRASGPDGIESFFGPLPARVDTLDELCLIVPRNLPFRFDEALGGFHLYGVDLCIQAVEANRSCFAIDAPCRHDSLTRHRPPEYHTIKRRLQRKWMFARRKVGRSVGTTCGRIRFGIFEGWV